MINNQKKILTAWIDLEKEPDIVNVDCDDEMFQVPHAFSVLAIVVDYLLDSGYTMNEINKFVCDGRFQEKQIN